MWATLNIVRNHLAGKALWLERTPNKREVPGSNNERVINVELVVLIEKND